MIPVRDACALLLAVLLLASGCSDESAAPGAPADPIAALVTEAQGFYDANDHEQSAATYARAAELAEAQGDTDQAMRLRAQQGVCLKMAGHTNEAREQLLPALAWAREAGDRHTEGLALGNLARVEALDGHDAKALEYLDQLVALVGDEVDPRTEVLTLEQAGLTALRLGDGAGALQRFNAALAANDAHELGEDDRHDALLRETAQALAALGDDLGAAALRASVPSSAPGLANEARHLSDLGLHAKAAQVALAAAQTFAQDPSARQGDRDRALVLHLSELLLAGDTDGCATGLDDVLAQGGDPEGRAPFQVVAGRLALARSRPADAVDHLSAARQAIPAGDPARDEAGWLLAVAQLQRGGPEDALATLDDLPDSLAAGLLRAWVRVGLPPEDALAVESLPRLDPDQDLQGDDSLAHLRRLCPLVLPSLAWATLHHHLADADRLRGADRTELAEAMVKQGIRQALRWQVLEARAEVLDRWPTRESIASAWQTIDRWIGGELPEQAAVVAVVPGLLESYLVVCTAELGGTTLGVRPEGFLIDQVGAVVDALRTGGVEAVAGAGRSLFEALFEPRALVDLEGKRQWLMLWPEILAAVPPALLVTDDPVAGEPVPWLVREVDLTLLPHAPVDAGPWSGPAQGVVRVAAPLVDAQRDDLAAQRAVAVYGAGALEPGPDRAVAEGMQVLSGAQATAGAVLGAACARLELDVPGVGGGRLGGMFLSPDPDASRGDARAGFLPWHRLAEAAPAPLIVCDRTRFDPSDVGHGPTWAATAVLLGGAREVVLTRWPMPPPVRDALAAELSGRLPSPWAVSEAQRHFLQAIEASGGNPSLEHPITWGAWMSFAAP